MAHFCPMTGDVHCDCSGEKEMPFNTPEGNLLLADMKALLRYGWTDHAGKTNWLIISSFPVDQPDNKEITASLLQNPARLGRILRPFAGDAWVARFEPALTEHLVLAKGAIDPVRRGDKAGVAAALKKLYANSDMIGQLLHDLRPDKLPLEVTQTLFREHNEHVVKLVTLRQEKKYAEYIVEYDIYYKHMMSLSDTLYEGLTF